MFYSALNRISELGLASLVKLETITLAPCGKNYYFNEFLPSPLEMQN